MLWTVDAQLAAAVRPQSWPPWFMPDAIRDGQQADGSERPRAAEAGGRVTRPELPRAYLRIDPNIDQTHSDNLEAFVRLLCIAGRQPERGRFRTKALFTALMGKAKAHHLYDRGDVRDLEDGRVYVVGWDEWQEGDHTVSDRMRRMRDRRKRDSTVTRPSLPRSPDVSGLPLDAVAKEPASPSSATGGSDSPQPPTSGGRRADKTNPRALVEYAKRAADQELEERRLAARGIKQRYYNGEITESEMDALMADLLKEPDDLTRASA
jgi:hypothetical protein